METVLSVYKVRLFELYLLSVSILTQKCQRERDTSEVTCASEVWPLGGNEAAGRLDQPWDTWENVGLWPMSSGSYRRWRGELQVEGSRTLAS